MRLIFAFAFGLLFCVTVSAEQQAQFKRADVEFLKRFTLSALPPLPAAPDNQYADDNEAARLGRRLFFDTGLSINGAVSCASCHQPEHFFSDARRVGVGVSATRRNTQSLLGASYGPWKYWDGRKDSLWSQALEPIEASNEHGFSRALLFEHISSTYESEYRAIFGELPSSGSGGHAQVLANIGKALMAYQRKLKIGGSRFDKFVNELDTGGRSNEFTGEEIAGLRLFMGRAACVSCHNGPLFTNFEFHNIGVPEADRARVDLGRYGGIEKLRVDEFNCLSPYSDAAEDQCAELTFLKQQGPELVGAFKTPGLRNVEHTAPYMHAGQMQTLEEVLQHYNLPSPPFYDREQHPSRPHFDIVPLRLEPGELDALIAFLRTLSSPFPDDDPWWQAPRE